MADSSISLGVAAALAKAVGGGGSADPNALHGVSVNGTAAPVTNKVASITVPTNTSDLTNDSTWQTEAQIDSKIDARLSSTYKAGGSCSFLELPALTSANLGFVVNLTEDFTTDSDFVEGSGVTYPAGTNVVVALVGNTYMYDVLAGFVDLSDYVEKSRKIGGVALSGDVPVTVTDDSVVVATNTGNASGIGYRFSHADSGVTAGSKGDATAQTPAFGGTFKALSATVDAKGHITALSEHNVTLPNAIAVSGGANGLMTGADKAKLDGASFPVTTDAAPSVSFTSAAAGRPVLPVVHIAPQQADGTPSPSNPLPITGRTAANVTLAKMGKNLLNAPGSYSASSQLIIGTIKLSSGRYSLSANVTNSGASVAGLRLYDLSGAVRGDLYVQAGDSSGRVSVSFTMDAENTLNLVISGRASGLLKIMH